MRRLGHLLAILRAAVVVTGTFLYIVVIGGVTLPIAIWRRDPEWIYRIGVRGCRLCLWLAGVKTVVENPERLHPGRPCVYVFNHASNIDPPACATILPRIIALGKKEVWKIPVFNRALDLTGFIAVDRGTERASAAVNAGVERLRQGLSIMAFPEGTRSRTGELLPFRHGVFLLAIRAGAPVVPITIVGSRAIQAKGQPGIRPGTVRFVVHPPAPTEGLREDERAALADRVRATIASAL
jgi:1-acyl-sn-glycerol-3-phosphate acyltransferase